MLFIIWFRIHILLIIPWFRIHIILFIILFRVHILFITWFCFPNCKTIGIRFIWLDGLRLCLKLLNWFRNNLISYWFHILYNYYYIWLHNNQFYVVCQSTQNSKENLHTHIWVILSFTNFLHIWFLWAHKKLNIKDQSFWHSNIE